MTVRINTLRKNTCPWRSQVREPKRFKTSVLTMLDPNGRSLNIQRQKKLSYIFNARLRKSVPLPSDGPCPGAPRQATVSLPIDEEVVRVLVIAGRDLGYD
ncbi:13377_t:CDS:2, partial [Acaulospora colombiana]